MKFFQKKTCLVLSLLMLISLFSGCSSANESEVTATPTPSSTDSTDTFNYSDGIDENGFWEGITASDYITLPEYIGIVIPADVSTITDEDVQTEIDNILSSFSTSGQVTDRAVEDGDTVNIDYVGTIDGVEFDGGSTGGNGTSVTIGETQYIDDFLAQLIGHTPGETINVEVTFPEDYGDEAVNGKDAVFTTTINYIEGETIVPELTDAFVAENLTADYGWTTVAEMTEGIRADLLNAALVTYVQDYVVDGSGISETPQMLIDYQTNETINYYTTSASSYGVDVDTYVNYATGYATLDELISSYSEDILYFAKSSLVLQAIAEEIGIVVTDDDIAEYFSTVIGTEDYSSYVEYYGQPYLKLVIMNEKVVSYLLDNSVNE